MKKRISFFILFILVTLWVRADVGCFESDGLCYNVTYFIGGGFTGSGINGDLGYSRYPVVSGAVVCAPKEGKYKGMITIPLTTKFPGCDIVWEDKTYHFDKLESIPVKGCTVDAFENSPDLTKVTFPDRFYEESNSVRPSFQNCSKLQTVINMNLREVYDHQFDGCKSLQSLDLSKANKIEDYAFYNCQNLNRIDLQKVKLIGNHAFDGCASLNTDGINTKSINLKNLSYIGDYAFSECTSLYSVTFSGYVRPISESKGEGVFAGCRSLYTVERFEGYSVEELGEKFFYLCTNLMRITLDKNIKKIGISAFEGCQKLENISGGFTLREVGFSAFKDSKNLMSIDCNWDTSDGSYIDEAAFYNCWKLDFGVEPVKVPMVGKQSFYSCRSLEAIEIPNEEVPEESFYDCNSLTTIIFNHANAYTTGLKIGKQSFYNCKKLIVFSGWIANTDEYAFENCEELGSIVWCSDRGDLGQYSFKDCSALERLTIINKNGSKNHKIEYGAFSGCNELDDIFHAGVTEFPKIQSGAFPTKIEEEYATLYASYEEDVEYQQELRDDNNSWNRFIYQEVAYYDWQSVYSAIFCRDKKYRHLLNASLVSGDYHIPLKIEDNYVTAIDYKAFMDNQLLTSLHIPVQIQEIDAQILRNCSNLQRIYVHWATPYVFPNNLPEDEQPFAGVNFEKVTLYVPIGCKKLYEQAPEWKRFNIKEESYLGESWALPAERHHHRHYKKKNNPSTEQKQYVVYNNNTLTFYCDNQQNNRQGTVYELNEGGNEPGWSANAKNITTVVFDESFANARPTSTFAWFNGCENLLGIQGLENLNTSNVTNLGAMFRSCSGLTSLDLSGFKTDNVEDMRNIFNGCSSLKTIYVNEDNWNTSKVTIGNDMFKGCTNLVGGNGTKYDENHIDAEYARIDKAGAPGYLTAKDGGTEPVGNKEAYAVYNDFSLTFYYDDQRSKRSGKVYSLNEGGKDPEWVIDENNRNVEKVVFDASFANARPTTTYSWFQSCDILREIVGIENLNTSEVTNMHTMFAFCKKLESVDVTHFDTRMVGDMAAMFSNCNSLKSIDLSHFDTSSLWMMMSMFNGCNSLTEINLSSFNTSRVEIMDYLFYGCSNLRTIYLGNGFTSTNSVSCEEAFAGCQNLSKVVFTGDIPASINSSFFDGVGTANSPVKLDVPEQYTENYEAKFDGNMFYGGYFVLQGVTSIIGLSADSQHADVYSLSGTMVKKDATSLKGLPKGVYIVNGRKMVVK